VKIVMVAVICHDDDAVAVKDALTVVAEQQGPYTYQVLEDTYENRAKVSL